MNQITIPLSRNALQWGGSIKNNRFLMRRNVTLAAFRAVTNAHEACNAQVGVHTTGRGKANNPRRQAR